MPWSAKEDFERYEAAGVEAVELCAAKFPDDKDERFELAKRFKESSMAVASIQTEVHSIFPDSMANEPKEPTKRLERFKRELDLWAETLEEPGLPFVLISGVVPDQNLNEGWKQARRFLKQATRFAESRNAKVAFEPLAPCMMYFDTFIHSLDQGVELVESAESASAGLVIDTWHVWQERELEPRLEFLAPRVFVTHVSDWPKDEPRMLLDRLLPGDGVIPLRERILDPLRSGGYQGAFAIEVLSDESLAGSLWNLEPAVFMRRARAASEAIS